MPKPPEGTVTLLYADLESSTRLQRLLRARYPPLLDDLLRILREAATRFEGYEIDTGGGDQLYVAFSSASQAVEAAAAAQRSVAKHEWPADTIVRVRMGIDTGQPILTDGRYFGEEVSRVARIMGAAHGGQVLLSQSTADFVRDRLGEKIDLLSLGAYQLRDFDEPEQLYQLVLDGEPEQFPPLRASELQTSGLSEPRGSEAVRFVNRSAEIELFRAHLAGAIAGRTGVVFLSGDPGIGKTRLIEELDSEATSRGFEVIWGRCWETEGARPFWPWVQILRQLTQRHAPLALRSELGPGAGLIAELVPELADRVPDLPPSPLLAPEEARFQLFDSIATFLRNAASAKPVLLLLDDLHWADKPSLLMVQFLLQHLREARLSIVGTYRDVDLDRRHPLSELLPSLRRERAFERLALAGLDEEAVGDFVTSYFEQPLDERGWAFVRALTGETDGNPFFVQEELRYLIENERIVWREGLWISDARSIAELGMPEAIKDLVGRRLDRLSETTTTLLAKAAVVGREFDATNLLDAGGGSEIAMDTALDEAETAHIIEERPDEIGRYRFRHAIFRDVVYAGLSSSRRARLHLEVGELLERVYAGDIQSHLDELAYHFVRASRRGQSEKAIDYSQRAGDQALATYAYEEAVRHYQVAFRLLAQLQGTESTRCTTLLKLAQGLMHSDGSLRVATEVAPRAAELAESVGDAELVLRACRAGLLALRRYASTSANLMPEYRQWLDRAEPYAAAGSSGRLWIDINRQFLRGSEGYTSETWIARLGNLDQARTRGEPDLLCRAASSVLAVAPPRCWREQVLVAREYANASWSGVDAGERSAFDTYCSAMLLDGGDREGWSRLHDEMRLRAGRLRDPYIRFWGFFGEHGHLVLDGHLLDALDAQRRMLEGTRLAGMQAFGLANAIGPGGRNLIYLGRAPAGLELVRELDRVAGRGAEALSDLAVLCKAHLGLRDEVTAALERLVMAKGAIAERGIVTIVQYLEAAVLVGHCDAAAALADALAPAERAATCRIAYTCAARHLSAAAELLGNRPQALAYARRALEVSNRIRHRPEIALVRLQLAELLLERHAVGGAEGATNRGEAVANLRTALAEFTDMHMEPSLERAKAVQRRLPSMNSPMDGSSR
jgi:class 3 adenylate cyclase